MTKNKLCTVFGDTVYTVGPYSSYNHELKPGLWWRNNDNTEADIEAVDPGAHGGWNQGALD